MAELEHRGDMHGGGKAVVRGLAHIDVIVGMHRGFAAALSRQHLVRPAGDHLIGIHIGLGAGAGLPDHQRELLVELAGGDFRRGGGDGLADLGIEGAQLHIGLGSRLLQQAEGMDQRQRHPLPADAEVLQGALGLGAPIMRHGHRDLAHGIGFDACLLGGHAEPPQENAGQF